MDDCPSGSRPRKEEEHVTSLRKGQKRKAVSRSRSSSTSSSSSKSSSTSSSSEGKRKKHHKQSKNKRRRRRENSKFNELLAAVSDLKNQINSKNMDDNCCDYRDDCVSLDVGDDCSIYSQDQVTGTPRAQAPSAKPDVTFPLSTKTKEPVIASACSTLLDNLKDLQRFEQPQWNDVRYSEVQKLYLQTPGFTNLEANEEVTKYDQSKTTTNMEKAFASLTCALLKQRNALQSDLNAFLSKVQQGGAVNYEEVDQKLNSTLSNGEYIKIFNDTLQIVCGRRAELVQHRRETILSTVRDPLYKSSLRKIAPTCSHLFEPEKFTAVLDKAGGVRKVFWDKDRQRQQSTRQYQSSGASQFKKPTDGPKRQRKQNANKKGGSFRGNSFKDSNNKPETKKYGRNKSPPSSHREKRYNNSHKS